MITQFISLYINLKNSVKTTANLYSAESKGFLKNCDFIRRVITNKAKIFQKSHYLQHSSHSRYVSTEFFRFNRNLHYKNQWLLVIVLLFQLGCAHTPGDDNTTTNDRFETANRSVQHFNDRVDSLGLKPTAKGYISIVPAPAERAVSNFFSNVADPVVATNQFLQGKFKLGIEDSARFIFNSTFGLAGLIDIASPMGLPKHEEDFGQTFAVWGVGSGSHLNVPFWGPSNLRDGAGSIVGAFAYPLGHLNDIPTRNRLAALLAVDNRAALFSTESLITGDRYLFIRDAYNQRREFLIKDGEVEDAFLDGIEE